LVFESAADVCDVLLLLVKVPLLLLLLLLVEVVIPLDPAPYLVGI